MKFRKNDSLWIFISILVATALAILIPTDSGLKFISMLPNILSTLLAGILASLAIIFGLLGSKDLSKLKKDIRKDGRDPYLNFLENTKFDAKLIFFSLVVSNIIFVIYDFELLPDLLDIQKRIFLALDLIILIFSLSSAYDVIISLFYLNELRYELSEGNESN